MYNTKLVCTYSFYDPNIRSLYHADEKFDLEDVEEFSEMSDLIYKSELLKALGVSFNDVNCTSREIDFNVINEKLTDLFSLVKSDVYLMNCIRMLKNKNLMITENNLDDLFIFLFSYDYFFLTHKCICEIFEFGKVSENTFEKLKKALK
jgi:hypothetical protein